MLAFCRASKACSSNTAQAATHPAAYAKSAFIYAIVLEGAIRSQVNDGPVTTYQAGQSFSELPGDRHNVSANASKTKPAKLLAVFVVDTTRPNGRSHSRTDGHTDFAMVGHAANPSTSRSGPPPRRSACH